MILHILPGDAYIDSFRGTGLKGDVAIFREALVEGDLRGSSISEFWKTREAFHWKDRQESDLPSYHQYVAAEIEKLLRSGTGDEINLWFEYELFCSVNYWFCLHLLRDSSATIYRIAPTVRNDEIRWKGFAQVGSEELLECWKERVQLSSESVELGSELWQAFKTGNEFRLRTLGETKSSAFPYLKEVAEAAAELSTRPKQVLREIASEGEHDFGKIFSEFGKRAGVYGFGDSQIKNLLDEIR